MPTKITEIVEHRAMMLRSTLRDTPSAVVVAMDAAQIRKAIGDEKVDPFSPEGYHVFKTRLMLNSRKWNNFSETDIPAIVKLGRRRPSNVVIAVASSPHRATCWVRDGYSGYRSAFKAFIKKVYGKVDFDGYSDMEIDHLASRGQKRMGNKFIRIEAVDKSVNRSHGATVEKKQAGQTKRDRRVMDQLTIVSVLKLYGLKPPRDRFDEERFEAIRKTMKADGWDTKEVQRGIETLLRLYAHKMD